MAEDAKIRAESLGYHRPPAADTSQPPSSTPEPEVPPRSTTESMAAEEPPENPWHHEYARHLGHTRPPKLPDDLKARLGNDRFDIQLNQAGLSLIRKHDAPVPDVRAQRIGTAMPDPKRFTVEVHGSPTGVKFGGHDISAKELAEVIKASPGYRQGEPIRLLSCRTGADTPDGSPNFAEQLSKELGVEVLAPKTDAWVDNYGNMYASGDRASFDVDSSGAPQPHFDDPGQWVSHSPDGTKAVHDSPFPPGHDPQWVKHGAQAQDAVRRGIPPDHPQAPKEFHHPGGPRFSGIHHRKDAYGTDIPGHISPSGEFVPHAHIDAYGRWHPHGQVDAQGRWVPGHVEPNGRLVPNGHFDDRGRWIAHGRTDDAGRWVPVHFDGSQYHDLARFNPHTQRLEPLGYVNGNGQFVPSTRTPTPPGPTSPQAPNQQLTPHTPGQQAHPAAPAAQPPRNAEGGQPPHHGYERTPQHGGTPPRQADVRPAAATPPPRQQPVQPPAAHQQPVDAVPPRSTTSSEVPSGRPVTGQASPRSATPPLDVSGPKVGAPEPSTPRTGPGHGPEAPDRVRASESDRPQQAPASEVHAPHRDGSPADPGTDQRPTFDERVEMIREKAQARRTELLQQVEEKLGPMPAGQAPQNRWIAERAKLRQEVFNQSPVPPDKVSAADYPRLARLAEEYGVPLVDRPSDLGSREFAAAPDPTGLDAQALHAANPNLRIQEGFGPVYRHDRRSPAEILADGGFRPRERPDTHEGHGYDLYRHVDLNEWSHFVSTSTDLRETMKRSIVRGPGNVDFVYAMEAPGGLNVNRSMDNRIYGGEQEIAFAGGVDARYITGAFMIERTSSGDETVTWIPRERFADFVPPGAG
ncbi:hypothetical protein HUO13_34460 [Saccharopolyspora erythraea]|uniref:scabin-related ADP-ribosyltransferase n=1 Tax=Saccharopolyspora erythraea TaxID=1836 RepID=UPI001BACEA3E|nr:hypothetical protein [Saccharopolyspora erythraea]QUH05203.1 hypothetical protein HUO13_34460 [Saccharopolyspora erythraea]